MNETLKKLEITKNQRDLLRHALGLSGCPANRNYFVIGPGCRDFEDWEHLVAIGLAEQRPYNLSLGDFCFRATAEGKRHAK